MGNPEPLAALCRDLLGCRYLGDVAVRKFMHLREQRHNERFRELMDNIFLHWRTL